ncbi:MAG: hypothetical protein ACKOWH_02170 [Rhodoluna sp.]
MNEKDIDARLKAADPAKKIKLNDSIVEAAIEAKPRRAFSPRQIQFSIVGVAAVAVLALALPSVLPKTSSGYLISLGENQATASRAAGGGTGAEVSDKMMTMMPWVQYEYVAGEKLSNEPGSGHVYQLALKGDPESVLSSVAKVFGVAGDVSKQSPEYGEDTYVVGSKDGSAESVSIWWGGTGSWWYSNPAAWPQPKCLHYTDANEAKGEETSGGDSASGEIEKWCDRYEELPATPELIPSQSELTAQALKIFKATGLDVSADDLIVNRDDWGAWASASLKVAGADTPIEWSLNWSQNGKLAYATGQAVRVIDRGSFNTISEKDAVARMADWRYSGAIANSLWQKYTPKNGPMLRGNGGVAIYDDMATDDASPDATVTDGASTEPAPPTEPSPSVEPTEEPMPTPSLVLANVNRAHSALMMIWDKAGNAWLVPGYIFIADVEYSWPTAVFALEDGIVELPEAGEVGITY